MCDGKVISLTQDLQSVTPIQTCGITVTGDRQDADIRPASNMRYIDSNGTKGGTEDNKGTIII